MPLARRGLKQQNNTKPKVRIAGVWGILTDSGLATKPATSDDSSVKKSTGILALATFVSMVNIGILEISVTAITKINKELCQQLKPKHKGKSPNTGCVSSENEVHCFILNTR